MSNIVLDSNIFIKVFLSESDSNTALELLEYLNTHWIKIIIPELLIIEIFSVCLAQEVDSKTLLEFFNLQQQIGVRVPMINHDVLSKACEIASTWNPKSGYPSFNDSLFHALAVCVDTVFITADHRHLAKTKDFGHISLLKDWKSTLK